MTNPHSYTKLDENGNELADTASEWTMVRDNVTGLIWEVKEPADGISDYSNPRDADNKYTWYDSNPSTNGGDAGTPGDGTDTEDFIQQLNDSNYGGHNDWRMPTIKELSTLVHAGRSNPAVDETFFPGTQSMGCWSSSPDANNPENAWHVYFNGYINHGNLNKSYGDYVRAVRGGQCGSLDHLVIHGDGTVTDTNTGLMWRQDTTGPTTWAGALQQCEQMEHAGYDDWRLPDKNELQTIVNYAASNPAAYTEAFPDTQSSYYWSSSTYADHPEYALLVYFNDGYVYGRYKSYDYYVRAVRKGQVGSLDPLAISSPGQGAEWAVGSTGTITWDPGDLSGDVTIALSRDGGGYGDIATTANDGSYDWTVTGPESDTCVIRITPLEDTRRAGTSETFAIERLIGDLNADGKITMADALEILQIVTDNRNQ